jgi:hypothetical protein
MSNPLDICSLNPDPACGNSASSLNRECFCRTLDRDKLLQSLSGKQLQQNLLQAHPHLFSDTAVFISPRDHERMQALVAAFERLTHSPHYRQTALARLHEPPVDRGTAGVFMGYDFHLTEEGPRLIEINTNAGGGFLNAVLVGAQTACCQPETAVIEGYQSRVEQAFVDMFRQEWRNQRGDQPLVTLAIVDDQPEQQFLFPEFRLAQQLFTEAGIECVIADAADLIEMEGKLFYGSREIQMVYNRLTDFYLTEPHHQALLQSHNLSGVVLSPDPFHYALYADKRNLINASNADYLAACGLATADREVLLEVIPATLALCPNNSEELWQRRRQYFFKPATGFGSRAAYRGDKITNRVWSEIQRGGYVAQELVPPSLRAVLQGGQPAALKLDIRAYVYQGRIQLLAARLYQGQTTNMRTPGGGFAPVLSTARSIVDL